jgi:hypothetical protein
VSAGGGGGNGGEQDVALFRALFQLQLTLVGDCWPEPVRLHALSSLAGFINMVCCLFVCLFGDFWFCGV